MGVSGLGPDVEVLWSVSKDGRWGKKDVFYFAKLVEGLIEVLFLGGVLFHSVMVTLFQLPPVESGHLVCWLGVFV